MIETSGRLSRMVTIPTALPPKGGQHQFGDKLEKKEKKKKKRKKKRSCGRRSRSAEGLAYEAFARPTKFLKDPQDTPLWPMSASAERTKAGASDSPSDLYPAQGSFPCLQ